MTRFRPCIDLHAGQVSGTTLSLSVALFSLFISRSLLFTSTDIYPPLSFSLKFFLSVFLLFLVFLLISLCVPLHLASFSLALQVTSPSLSPFLLSLLFYGISCSPLLSPFSLSLSVQWDGALAGYVKSSARENEPSDARALSSFPVVSNLLRAPPVLAIRTCSVISACARIDDHLYGELSGQPGLEVTLVSSLFLLFFFFLCAFIAVLPLHLFTFPPSSTPYPLAWPCAHVLLAVDSRIHSTLACHTLTCRHDSHAHNSCHWLTDFADYGSLAHSLTR